jgi:hypothetical protein
MASFVMKLFMTAGGAGTALNRDSASLLLLTAAEAVFYWFYLRGEEKPSGSKEAGQGKN